MRLTGEHKQKRRYAVVDGGRVLLSRMLGCDGYEIRWVSSCSGCFESEDGHPVGEYPWHEKHHCYIGAGCRECGFRGIRRQYHWVPLDRDAARFERAMDRRWRRQQERERAAA